MPATMATLYSLMKGIAMNTKLLTTGLIAGALLAPYAVVHAADADANAESKTKNFVKDSVITTKIKAKLASEHLGSAAHIKVDTDNNGVVWMSGTANSQAEVNQAITIARNTEGVKTVKSDLKVQKDR